MTGAASILGGGVAPISFSAAFTSPNGASPQSTNTPNTTVPAGNSGEITLNIGGSGGVSARSINGAAFSSFIDSDTLTIADTQTLQFKLTGATKSNTYTLTDNDTGLVIATFTITTT